MAAVYAGTHRDGAARSRCSTSISVQTEHVSPPTLRGDRPIAAHDLAGCSVGGISWADHAGERRTTGARRIRPREGGLDPIVHRPGPQRRERPAALSVLKLPIDVVVAVASALCAARSIAHVEARTGAERRALVEVRDGITEIWLDIMGASVWLPSRASGVRRCTGAISTPWPASSKRSSHRG